MTSLEAFQEQGISYEVSHLKLYNSFCEEKGQLFTENDVTQQCKYVKKKIRFENLYSSIDLPRLQLSIFNDGLAKFPLSFCNVLLSTRQLCMKKYL